MMPRSPTLSSTLMSGILSTKWPIFPVDVGHAVKRPAMELMELFFMLPVDGQGFTSVQIVVKSTVMETLTVVHCEIPLHSQNVFLGLPKELLAFSRWLLTSASMLAERENVPPRKQKCSTVCNFCRVTVMFSSGYGFPGPD